MMPPFVVLPTNRIAHFVEVSLYFILSSTTSKIKYLLLQLLTHTLLQKHYLHIPSAKKSYKTKKRRSPCDSLYIKYLSNEMGNFNFYKYTK